MIFSYLSSNLFILFRQDFLDLVLNSSVTFWEFPLFCRYEVRKTL